MVLQGNIGCESILHHPYASWTFKSDWEAGSRDNCSFSGTAPPTAQLFSLPQAYARMSATSILPPGMPDLQG